MTWLDEAKAAAEDAEEKLKSSETLLGLAEEAYRKKPTRANLLMLQAANRLVKESEAVLAEWQLDDGRGE